MILCKSKKCYLSILLKEAKKMASRITPKFKHNIARIIPFGLIWLLIGWMFSISEALLPQSMNNQSSTDIKLTLPVILFTAFSLTFLGLLVGTMETLIFQKRFVEPNLKVAILSN